MHTSYEAVLGLLVEGLQWLLSPKEWRTPGKAAISQARQRLGWEPLKQLYEEVVRPVAEKETQGAWYRGRRVVSLDGSTLEVADTEANEKAFGRPGASRGTAAYPLLRFVGLVENGTHVLFGAQLGGYRTGESTLAQAVVQLLCKGMLCLADREFLSYKLWNEARRRGAALLWRGKKNLLLPCYRRLPDGSYLSFLYASTKDRKQHRNGVLVRVIEYRLQGVAKKERFYRLVTTLLNPSQAPAQELAALYHERWEMETALDEFKVHLRGARLVLRSKTPDLVRQEFYGFLLSYFAIRGLMHEAALSVGEDADHLSFANAVEVVRRKLYTFNISPLRRAGAVA
jgi:Transposase DDE domain/Insertion element 4 transposase N-terminal